MSNEPDDESADSQQESEQQSADSDQPQAQTEEQSAEQNDQSTEQSEEQPAESEQPADQAEEQPTDSDQGAEQSEEQPAESEQPADQAEEQPTDSDQSAEQPEEQSAQGDQPAAAAEDQSSGTAQPAGQASQRTTQSPAPKRPYGVESWRPLVTEMAGDIPVEVLLRWIKRESEGNPCATGAPATTGGGSIENGIFQLYSPDQDHLATPAQLHGSFCSGQTCIRDLTLEEARIQVASGIALVNSLRNLARAHLKAAGVVWQEGGSDFWSLVKMEHNIPVTCRDYLKTLRPASWSEFKAGVLTNPPKQYSGKIDGILSLAEDIGAGAV